MNPDLQSDKSDIYGRSIFGKIEYKLQNMIPSGMLTYDPSNPGRRIDIKTQGQVPVPNRLLDELSARFKVEAYSTEIDHPEGELNTAVLKKCSEERYKNIWQRKR